MEGAGLARKMEVESGGMMLEILLNSTPEDKHEAVSWYSDLMNLKSSGGLEGVEKAVFVKRLAELTEIIAKE